MGDEYAQHPYLLTLLNTQEEIVRGAGRLQACEDSVAMDEIFEDQLSGANTGRTALQQMLRYVRKGDTIHVHSIDRLARILKDLLDPVEDLKCRGVQLQFHKEGLIFTGEQSHTQDLMLSMMGAIAQFERSMIQERQAEGIAKAKAAGVYKGRKKS